MTREERLKHLAESVFEVIRDEREAKEEKEDLRKEIFRLIRRGFENDAILLPVRTVEVPASYWEATGQTMEEFAESRFPGWDIEHVEKNIQTGDCVFIFKKNPDFMGHVVETDSGVRVVKSVSEYQPEVDWETLTAEFPDIADRIGRVKIEIEINEDELAAVMEEDPEVLAKLQRHLKSKQPSLRMTATKVKDDNE